MEINTEKMQCVFKHLSPVTAMITDKVAKNNQLPLRKNVLFHVRISDNWQIELYVFSGSNTIEWNSRKDVVVQIIFM